MPRGSATFLFCRRPSGRPLTGGRRRGSNIFRARRKTPWQRARPAAQKGHDSRPRHRRALRRGQALRRRAAGARGHLAGGAAGRAGELHRPERLRQVHPAPSRRGADTADRRRGARGRPDAGGRRRRSWRLCFRADAAAVARRGAQHRGAAAAARLVASRARGGAGRRARGSSGWPGARRRCRASCRAGRRCACPSRARSRSRRKFCCSTSRSARSTR